MMIFKLVRRLEAAERSIAELRQAVYRPSASENEQEERPAFKLDDAKLQEGIANLMGYDPFTRNRGDA